MIIKRIYRVRKKGVTEMKKYVMLMLSVLVSVSLYSCSNATRGGNVASSPESGSPGTPTPGESTGSSGAIYKGTDPNGSSGTSVLEETVDSNTSDKSADSSGATTEGADSNGSSGTPVPAKAVDSSGPGGSSGSNGPTPGGSTVSSGPLETHAPAGAAAPGGSGGNTSSQVQIGQNYADRTNSDLFSFKKVSDKYVLITNHTKNLSIQASIRSASHGTDAFSIGRSTTNGKIVYCQAQPNSSGQMFIRFFYDRVNFGELKLYSPEQKFRLYNVVNNGINSE
jgi:hypothetical protein